MGIVWAPVDEASRHRQQTVAKKAGGQHVWRSSAGWQGDQMRPLRGTPCSACAPQGFAMVGVCAEVTCLTHPAGGTPRAWVGGPARGRLGLGRVKACEDRNG